MSTLKRVISDCSKLTERLIFIDKKQNRNMLEFVDEPDVMISKVISGLTMFTSGPRPNELIAYYNGMRSLISLSRAKNHLSSNEYNYLFLLEKYKEGKISYDDVLSLKGGFLASFITRQKFVDGKYVGYGELVINHNDSTRLSLAIMDDKVTTVKCNKFLDVQLKSELLRRIILELNLTLDVKNHPFQNLWNMKPRFSDVGVPVIESYIPSLFSMDLSVENNQGTLRVISYINNKKVTFLSVRPKYDLLSYEPTDNESMSKLSNINQLWLLAKPVETLKLIPILEKEDPIWVKEKLIARSRILSAGLFDEDKKQFGIETKIKFIHESEIKRSDEVIHLDISDIRDYIDLSDDEDGSENLPDQFNDFNQLFEGCDDNDLDDFKEINPISSFYVRDRSIEHNRLLDELILELTELKASLKIFARVKVNLSGFKDYRIDYISSLGLTI